MTLPSLGARLPRSRIQPPGDQILFLKASLLAIWAWVIASLVAPSSVPSSGVAPLVGGFLGAAHVLELILVRNALQHAGGSFGAHVAQTLVFGFPHWLPLWKEYRLSLPLE